MANFVDLVLDAESTGKETFGGTRMKFNPPRITQFGLLQIDPTDFKRSKMLIGAGPGGGWTNIIEPIVEKHGVQSELNLPPQFWRDLTAYDPSVAKKGSLLHEQVKDHVREYLALRKTGQTGAMKSATDYIADLQSAIQKQIDAGNTVRLHAWNKGFDTNLITNEMFMKGQKEGANFMTWLETHVKSGKLQLKGIEENIHRGMFDVMMEDPSLMPRFSSYKYFERARAAGLKTVGIEATTPHYALRQMIDDIKQIKGGAPAKQVLQGLPADIRAELGSIKDFDGWQKFQKWMINDPEGAEVVLSHYNKKAEARFGAKAAAHVRSLSFRHTMMWRQDAAAAKVFGGHLDAALSSMAGTAGNAKSHRAPYDTIRSALLGGALSDSQMQRVYAREALTNQAWIGEEAALKFATWQEEANVTAHMGNVKQAMLTASKSRVRPLAAASRLARSPHTLPLLAAAGGLLIADRIARDVSSPAIIDSMREQMQGKIEGLRRATSQWDIFGGIKPTFMSMIQTDFGSGRQSQWQDGYRGVPIHPSVDSYRQQYAMHPSWQYQELLASNRNKISGYGPTEEEIVNGRIDMADYIYSMKDADTILLRKAWLKQNVPVIGPAMGFIQRTLMDASKALTGQDMGFTVRVDDIDAPEQEHGASFYIPGSQPGAEESTRQMERLMRGSWVQRVLRGGRATHLYLAGRGKYGRVTGTPYAGGRDIAGELVRSGGAITTSLSGGPYYAAEQTAISRGEGIWENPEYQAIPEARRRGIRPAFSPLKRYSTMSRSLDTAALHSLMVYARNPHMHAVRDQYAQNLYSRGF